MKIFPSFIGLLLLTVCFTNCSKESDPDTNQTTKTDIISKSTWKYENAGIDQDKNGTIDLAISVVAPGVILSCQTDNILTFKANNSGMVDEGATKCNATDATTTNFNWNFADNETNLNISNNVFSIMNGKSKIISLTETALTLSRDTTVFNSNVALVVTLKH